MFNREPLQNFLLNSINKNLAIHDLPESSSASILILRTALSLGRLLYGAARISGLNTPGPRTRSTLARVIGDTNRPFGVSTLSTSSITKPAKRPSSKCTRPNDVSNISPVERPTLTTPGSPKSRNACSRLISVSSCHSSPLTTLQG